VPVERLIVPLPLITPLAELVKPAERANVPPADRLMEALLTKVVALTLSVPAEAANVPLLVKISELILNVCPVVLAIMLPLLVSAELL